MDITKITRPARKLLPLKNCGAVIVAAGNASRMGGIDKVMAPLENEPMIVRTVRTFQNCDAIKEIVIVTREDLILPITGLCAGMDKVPVNFRQCTDKVAERFRVKMRFFGSVIHKVKDPSLIDMLDTVMAACDDLPGKRNIITRCDHRCATAV